MSFARSSRMRFLEDARLSDRPCPLALPAAPPRRPDRVAGHGWPLPTRRPGVALTRVALTRIALTHAVPVSTAASMKADEAASARVLQCVSNLKARDVQELAAFMKPPDAVVTVFQALSVVVRRRCTVTPTAQRRERAPRTLPDRRPRHAHLAPTRPRHAARGQAVRQLGRREEGPSWPQRRGPLPSAQGVQPE